MPGRKDRTMIRLFSLLCVSACLAGCAHGCRKVTRATADQKWAHSAASTITIVDRNCVIRFSKLDSPQRRKSIASGRSIVSGVCIGQRKLYPVLSPSFTGPDGADVEATFRINAPEHPPRNPYVATIRLRYFLFAYDPVWRGTYPIQKGQKAYFLFDGRGKCLSIWIPPDN